MAALFDSKFTKFTIEPNGEILKFDVKKEPPLSSFHFKICPRSNYII